MLSDKQYTAKCDLERTMWSRSLTPEENKKYLRLLEQDRAPKPVEPLAGHKCLGARRAVEVMCECGWVSLAFAGEGGRAEAYGDWRAHVKEKHAKVPRHD